MEGNKFTPPTMDWSSPGDLHKRFKLFKQKCLLIFDGPLKEEDEDKKTRLLLLWSGDKGLEIYNTATWEDEDDQLKLNPVFGKFEQYTKPQSNQILARYQLRCLKQGEMSLEEFITKARALIDDAGYSGVMKEEMLRDTLIFGINSDKVRKDAIAKGNSLTYKSVYDLAKTEESTKAQMQAITKGNQQAALYSVKSKYKPPPSGLETPKQDKYHKKHDREQQDSKPKYKFKYDGCFRCGGKHSQSDPCPAINAKCNHCGKKGHFKKVCLKRRLKQVNEIVQSPDYKGQDIYLQDDSDVEESPTDSDDNDSSSDADHVIVIVGEITSEYSVDTVNSYPNKLFATIKINDKRSLKMKIDTGADTCILTTDDLQALDLSLRIKPCRNILKAYGGNHIDNLGTTTLKATFKDKSIPATFNIVDAPGHPSMIGCQQAQELGIITANIQELTTKKVPPKVEQAAQHGKLTKSQVLEEYSDCFDKIGRFPGETYHIQLIDDPKPVIHPPRSVPVHILPLYKQELDHMIKEDIITEVTEPTDWVNSIVCNVTQTPEGKKKVRLCLDPKDLNDNIRREHYYTRTIEEVLPHLHGKEFFSVADTTKGYWHVELDHESSLLCTFNTPFGRYRFKRLPFGINVSQDVFQRKLDEVYRDIDNVTGIADDIIISGATQQEHDIAFAKMLNATKENNVSLNSSKLQFKQPTVNFYGYTLSKEGILPTASKIEAIKNISAPTNAKELLSLLGMVTYLNRFSTKLAELTAPLRDLTKKNTHFKWEQQHQDTLENIKQELCSAGVISFYDPNPETTTILQCDASQEGLGAWLRQVDDTGTERIVAMASRALTKTESRYSNIERECLAVMYALEKFEYYLLGRHTLVETDHSPLEQIFKKNISEAPTRLQRMILRCLKFDIEVKYRRGQAIPVADALSRVCMAKDPKEVEASSEETSTTEYRVDFVTDENCPIDIDSVRNAVLCDPTMITLKNTIYRGWPDHRSQCPQELWDYWNFRCDLVLEDGLILKGDRVVIPESLRGQILKTTHLGHQGETKCLLLARQTTFWPGMTKDIKELVKDCEVCNIHQAAPPRLPILQPDLPTRPWEKLGADIFQFNDSKYLMIVDYYSRFPVIRLLKDMKASTVSAHFTSVLAEYGLPNAIITDFGSQFVSEDFRDTCKRSGINLTFSSPYHHQTNGLAEKSIGICKALWTKALESNQCPYTAVWMYRTTPIDDTLPSPYELLTGRKPRTLLPNSKMSLRPNHPQTESHQERNQDRQERQAAFYDRKASSDKETLADSQPVHVWNTLRSVWEPARIFNRPNPAREPRTYVVEMNGRLYQRTREHLRPVSRERSQQDGSQDLAPTRSYVPPTDCQPGKDKLPTQGVTDKDNLLPTLSSKPTLQETSSTHSTQRDQAEDQVIIVKGAKASFQPRSQVTRSGRATKVPAKFKE